MDLKIAHRCPQCGGPISLEETDRFFVCGYCRVRLHITARGPFHYRLSPRNGGDALLHVPYWRFKGVSYTLGRAGIQHRILDMTRIAVAHQGLPHSLGVRPQAVPLTFVSSATAGSFLAPATPLEAVLEGIDRQLTYEGMPADRVRPVKPAANMERAYIGETASVVFLPLLPKGHVLLDAVNLATQYRPVPELPVAEASAGRLTDGLPRFLPAVCPECGWDLDGGRESCVFACGNCERAWMTADRGLAEVRLGAVHRRDASSRYVPFWRIRPRVTGVVLESYADLIRYANLPKAALERWESQEMAFWTPAFKVRPQLFLLLAGLLTVTPPEEIARDRLRLTPAYPATLPLAEAEQSLKTELASLVVGRFEVFERLGEVTLRAEDSELVYLPFTPRGNECILEGRNVAVPAAALAHGKGL